MGRITAVDRKQSILDFLKEHGVASLGAVADDLGMSKQGALRHLEALTSKRLVESVQVEHSGAPGRPEHRFRLTALAADKFPQAHRQLAAELVSFMPDDQLSSFFAARAARLEADYAVRLTGLDSAGRVRELARLATENGHMATAIERADGSLAIRQCNCPIQEVAARTGHPCRQEQEMYGRLLGVEVERESWLGASDSSCTYVVKR